MHLGNWIRMTSAGTGGTGSLPLTAVTGYSQFSDQFATGADGACDYFWYSILNDADGTPVEAGIGSLSASTTFVRNYVMATYVSGVYAEGTAASAVNLSSGSTYRIICTPLQTSLQACYPGPRSGAAERLIASADLVNGAGNGNTKTVNTGTVYVVPFTLRTMAPISGAGAFVTGTASANIRLGIYKTTLGGEPGNLIAATGDIAATSTAFATGNWTGGTILLKPGRYYLAIKPNGANVPVYANEAKSYAVPPDSLAGMATASAFDMNTFGTAADSGSAMSTTMATLAWTTWTVDYSPTLYLVPVAL